MASTIVGERVVLGERLQPVGIDSTGTNADETNVSGKRIVKPNAFAVSGDDENSPMSAKTHENA